MTERTNMLKLRSELRKPLNQFVDCLWYSNGESKSHRKERLLPTGCIDLVFKLRDDRSVRIFQEDKTQSIGGAVVSGAYSRYYAIDTSQPSSTLGIHFRPGGAALFLGVPMSELMDRHINLEELWGREAVVLRERLMEAPSVSANFDLLEQTLLDRLTEPPHDYRAIRWAVEKFSFPTSDSVKAVGDSMGYRAKRFIRLFHDSVGLTPKLFCRIRRFQSVLDHIVSGEHVQWANVALDAGYFDQSHLIRDFRAFAGVTPLDYQPVESSRKNHMPLTS